MTDPDSSGTAQWTRGRRIALDVGTARIGVAACDPDGILATPVETITVRGGPDTWLPEVARVRELVAEYEAITVVVGKPVSLKGRATSSTAMAQSFVDALRAADSALDVETFDERLSTVSATAALHSAGRSTRAQRAVIDQAAAVVLLQSWLDARRDSV